MKLIARLGLLASAAVLLSVERSTGVSAQKDCVYNSVPKCTTSGCTKTCSLFLIRPNPSCPATKVDSTSNVPVDCVKAWREPGKQTTECDENGMATFEYAVETPESCGGKPCGTYKSRACKKEHCEVSDLMETECGPETNTKTLYRTILKEPKYGGGLCPPLVNVTAPCGGIDCVMTEWSAWSDEMGECKDGLAKRTRGIAVNPQFGGQACGPTTETRPCAHSACVYSAWSPSVCDPATGKKARTRTILQDAVGNGRPCNPERLREEALCDVEDCKYSPWSPFQCDPNTGYKTRSRTIVSEPAYGGASCTQLLQDVQACDAQDCVFKTPKCDQTTYLSVTTISAQNKFGGKLCPTELVTSCAPVDCVMSKWETGPLVSLGGKWQSKETRTVIKPAAFDGAECGELERTAKYSKCIGKDIKYMNNPPPQMAGAVGVGMNWCMY